MTRQPKYVTEPVDQATRNRIVADYAAGLKVSAIALAHGVSSSAVNRFARKYGAPRRREGRAPR